MLTRLKIDEKYRKHMDELNRSITEAISHAARFAHAVGFRDGVDFAVECVKKGDAALAGGDES